MSMFDQLLRPADRPDIIRCAARSVAVRHSNPWNLSPNTRQVIDLAVRGQTKAEICASMNYSVRQVERFLFRARRKMRVANNDELARKWSEFSGEQNQCVLSSTTRIRKEGAKNRFLESGSSTVPQNPWGLSPGQWKVLERIVDYGDRDNHAALALGVSPKTVGWHLALVRKKMNVKTTIQAAIVWDRARRVTA